MTDVRPLYIYNNLTRSKELFVPIRQGQISFYSCGPTTYDLLHVGNARALVTGDVMARVMRALGYQVQFARNFTDVDDKILERAKELGVGPLEHSARFVDECLTDMNSLGMHPATYTPKVSESIDEIIKVIQDLVDKGYAYVVNGEVLYHVPLFKEYGKLSRVDLEGQQSGIRVEVEKHKKHPADFVLWKPADRAAPAVWDSPWGPGRPGWHIECSAMARKLFGKQIDIHHGGIDLLFPHHENEIAQSEAANGCTFSHYWCHNAFLNFGSEKMSKSLGNVVTIRQFVKTYTGAVLRQVLCSAHYRSPMDWSEEIIERSMGDVERIHQFVVHVSEYNSSPGKDDVGLSEIKKAIAEMKDELAQDFNLPAAMAVFFGIIRLFNREYLNSKLRPSQDVLNALNELIEFTKLSTGLVHENAPNVLLELQKCKKKASGNDSNESEILDLMEKRKLARAQKNWGLADQVRDRLNELGVVVKDHPDGTATWSYK